MSAVLRSSSVRESGRHADEGTALLPMECSLLDRTCHAPHGRSRQADERLSIPGERSRRSDERVLKAGFCQN